MRKLTEVELNGFETYTKNNWQARGNIPIDTLTYIVDAETGRIIFTTQNYMDAEWIVYLHNAAHALLAEIRENRATIEALNNEIDSLKRDAIENAILPIPRVIS